MNSMHRTSLRRAAAGLAAALVVGGLALAQPARAVTATETSRLEGGDRYETAVAVARDTFPDGAPNVILATGQDFADALASSGMAGAIDAPILLTLTDRLLDVTRQGLADLEAETVYLMGGTAALSTTVEDQLVAAGYDVERVFGDTRFGTAAAAGQVIADQAAPVTGDGGIGSTSNGTTAILTNGLKFPDAVSASPVAYAGNLPILLTAKDVIPQVSLDAIESLGIEHVVVVGGEAVISGAVRERVENETGVTTQRLAGPVRWDTNLAVAEFGVDEVDMGGETVYLSTGVKFADALVGGPAAGQNLSRLLLVHTTKVPDPTQAYIEDNAGNIDALVAIGGDAAVPDDVLSAAATAAQLASNQVYDVSPATADGMVQSSGATNNDGRRTYEVSGLSAGVTYDIAVLDASVVSGQGTSSVRIESFTLAQGDSTAIETVNGSPVTSGGPAGSNTETKQVEGDASSSGELTFSIDSTEQDAVIPVIWLDEGTDDDELALVGDVPDEPFGIGGETQWVPAEAATGVYDDDRQTVQTVNRGGNFFTGPAGTFYYSSGDLFEVALGGTGTENIDFDAFEALLTVNDILVIDYVQDGQSIFSVYADRLADITDVSAAMSGPDKVQVSWTPSDQPDTRYDVYHDADGDRVLDQAEQDAGPAATAKDNASSVLVPAPPTSGTARYIVVPIASTTGEEDRPNDPDGSGPQPAPPSFFTNEVVVSGSMFGLTEGTTVATNVPNAAANEGDVWMLSFSRAVKIASNASITITAGGTDYTYANGTTRSTWTADGPTAVISLGSGATSTSTFTYSGANVTALTGVTDLAGNPVAASGLLDPVLEHNGPELMHESTTCNVGDTACTLTFNEPVDEAAAENPGNYGREFASPNTLNSVSLADDGRTITLSFGTGLSAGDRIRPATLVTAVEDDDGQQSSQAMFDFVLPDIGY